MEEIGKKLFDSKTVKYKTLLIYVFIFVFAVGLIVFFLQTEYFSSLQNNQDSDLVRGSGKDGVIYFSARTNKPNYLPSLFAIEVSSREIFVIESTKSNVITNTENVSPDQYSTVYSEAFLEIKDGQYYTPSKSQLVVFDARDNTTRTITNSNTYKTNPEWSPSGMFIAFMSRDLTGNISATDSESWDVMITDLSGSEAFITNGFQPQWFPDGIHLLVLKNDGLYILDKDTKNERKLSGIEEVPIFSNMKIDLSRDGSRVALSFSDSGEVFIIRILSLELPKGEVEGRIPGNTFWPVFSEDGNSVALYEVNLDLLGTDPQPRITIYNLETSEKETIYDLSTFDPESIAVTDWRK